MTLAAIRYYLNSDGSLRAVPTSGRCPRYWDLWTTRDRLEQAIAARPDEPRLSALTGQLADASPRLAAHLEVCPICRAWIDECREVCVNSPDPAPKGVA